VPISRSFDLQGTFNMDLIENSWQSLTRRDILQGFPPLKKGGGLLRDFDLINDLTFSGAACQPSFEALQPA
jgi:hypothetical protein